jgi:hypothetical protein
VVLVVRDRNIDHVRRCMIDTERGLALGHAPGTSYDSPGLAIAGALKAYNLIMRSSSSSRDGESLAQRAKQSNLRLFDELVSTTW